MNNSFSRETLETMWGAVKNDSEKLDILFDISLNTCERVTVLERQLNENFQRRGLLSTLATVIGRVAIWRS